MSSTSSSAHFFRFMMSGKRCAAGTTAASRKLPRQTTPEVPRLKSGNNSFSTCVDKTPAWRPRVAVCGNPFEILQTLPTLWREGYCVVPIDTSVVFRNDRRDFRANRNLAELHRMVRFSATFYVVIWTRNLEDRKVIEEFELLYSLLFFPE